MGSDLLVNDGSFMEKFKKLQQEKLEKESGGAAGESKAGIPCNSPGSLMPNAAGSKIALDLKPSGFKKSNPSASNGKLAFSLKQKSKLTVVPVKLGGDEDDDEGGTENTTREGPTKRQKLGQADVSEPSSENGVVGNYCFSSALNLCYSIHIEVSIDIGGKKGWLKEFENVERPAKRVVCIPLFDALAPSPPSDLAVKNAADKLASFVAKNGRQFEHITRQKNPGDTPFKYVFFVHIEFLYDTNSADYKYYEYRLTEEEKVLAQTKEYQTSGAYCRYGSAVRKFVLLLSFLNSASTSTSRSSSGSQRNHVHHHSNYQTPASALYEANLDARSSMGLAQATSAGVTSNDESSGPSDADPIAMMEFYVKKAAREERMRQPKHSKDEMPPPASLQAPGKRGHHMGDYIPQEELEKFLSKCNDAAAQRAAREAAERAKIQADNIGHKLLSKMGWREGEGLGSSKSGRSDPVMAGDVKLNNLGVGAEVPGEVTPDDDIYEQYKKRMMLGYRYRPNPLNNPRKAYY
ncbi:hypothetical protein ACLOJK_004075 [Asimina triloba]